ncbi:UvrD-helicase domain-containing protein [Flavobacterium cyclinae]|uniref:UvrD-helicase domain-containing protein n=1 Tax=Flavobacterium cyclinae TaxID=2895947 RepID=UPI001E610BB6|nr:UvrD-helicase domain-containing protein [Flavobacterium cyclinae]UGS20956.1 UvrD-helicase domain-containing protein [Flavobacterium cyclinae]
MNTTAFAIYDASAGSGKTYTLTKEYLKILFLAKNDDAYRKILAITFTNKAVEEMKTRIVSSLYQFSLDTTSDKAMELLKDVAFETKLSIATLKDKSKAIIKNIIHNYAAFDISTIDKFTHKVIRTFAQDLNLPPNFEVSLETDSLLQEAIDLVISKAGDDPNLTKLLIEFSKEKTDDDKNWDISAELLKVAQLITNENNSEEIKELSEKSIDDFGIVKKKLHEEIKQLKSDCKAIAQSVLELIDGNGVARKSFYSSYVTNHLEKIVSEKIAINETIINYLDGTKPAYSKTIPQSDKDFIDENASEILASVIAINEKVGKISMYEAFLQNLNPLSLLNTIYQEFKQIQEEQNLVSISDFNKIIHNEIQNQPAPFIYERLGEKYRHYFIDEFQDTSVMQWQNLIPLIDNALSGQDDFGQQGTLMLVGDPKQAIYRWRGGKAEQFIDLAKEDAKHNPFSNKDKETLRLGTNYRSFSEVIQFNNAFFKQLADKFENPDYKNLYENLSHQEINSKIGGYVNLSFIEVPEDETEVEGFDSDNDTISVKDKFYLNQTLKTIEKCISNGFEYKDIVLLTRTKAPGIKLANFLTENSVPILSSETLLIQNATEVKLLIALLRYLKNPKDDESKAYFLYFIAKYLQSELEIHDFILAAKDKNPEELETFLKTIGIEISFKNCKKKSLYEAVEILIATFLNDKVNTSYLQYFLDLVLEKDVKSQSSISDFLEYWDKIGYQKSIPSPEGTNAVRIMTIHKSKGLEFPVVIFPFAEENFSSKPKDKLWIPLEDANVDFPKALINNKKEVEKYGSEAKVIFQTKNQEEVLDTINVLYVALTRAEEQLYVISNKLKTKKGDLVTNNLSYYFLEFLQNIGKYEETKSEYEFGNSTRISKNKFHEGNHNQIVIVANKLNPKNIKIAQREALMWGTMQQDAITFGNILHEIMAFIHTKDDVDLAIQKTTELGLITFSQNAIFKETIEKIVNHPELKDYFVSDVKVFNEQNIIKKAAKTIKPDRVVLKGNQAYLLDYKTGEKHNKHKVQLEEYEMALQEMNYIVAKKALVYVGESIEIVTL